VSEDMAALPSSFGTTDRSTLVDDAPNL